MAVYATTADLYVLGASQELLGNVSVQDQDTALAAASRLADGYLSKRVTLPIAVEAGKYPEDLRRAVCQIAAWDCLAVRGLAPEGDTTLESRHDAAMKWLEAVAEGRVQPTWTDASPDARPGDDGPFVLSPVVDDEGFAAAEAVTTLRGF